jgi:hypothetical protein
MPYDFSPRIYTDEYYIALGKFVSEFSEIEQAMQIALWIISKVNSPVAQAVFSGVRADDAANKITRIGVAEKWDEQRKTEWKAISDRLGILRTLRNNILHYGVKWERENEWVITNRQFVHTPDNVTNTPVTVSILEAATDDIQSLSFCLFDFVFGSGGKRMGLSAVDRTLGNAWRYKPSRQAVHQDRTRDKAPKLKRRPQSSPK